MYIFRPRDGANAAAPSTAAALATAAAPATSAASGAGADAAVEAASGWLFRLPAIFVNELLKSRCIS